MYISIYKFKTGFIIRVDSIHTYLCVSSVLIMISMDIYLSMDAVLNMHVQTGWKHLLHAPLLHTHV